MVTISFSLNKSMGMIQPGSTPSPHFMGKGVFEFFLMAVNLIQCTLHILSSIISFILEAIFR